MIASEREIRARLQPPRGVDESPLVEDAQNAKKAGFAPAFVDVGHAKARAQGIATGLSESERR